MLLQSFRQVLFHVHLGHKQRRQATEVRCQSKGKMPRQDLQWENGLGMMINKATHILKSLLVLSVAFVFFLLGGCWSSADKVLYEGSYKGDTYVVKSHETRNFNGSRIDWRIKLGDLPELPVNITLWYGNPVPSHEVTTDWGPPYRALT